MDKDLSELLFNAINEQGYLFQEACEKALKDSTRRTHWEVKAYEYPVSLEGQDTRIDIVLQSQTSDMPQIYAILECKRADPSYSQWLFGAPGLPFGDALCSTLCLECPSTGPHRDYFVESKVEQLHFTLVTNGVNNWQEVKARSTGRVSNPQNIENAFIQVLKGIGGLAQEQLAQRRKMQVPFKTAFIPIVVTTAKLYVAYYELKDIQLATGKINKESIFFGPQGEPPEEIDWILVDYGAGASVAQNTIPKNYYGLDPSELKNYKNRSIFVVNSKSLVKFFSKLHL